jgi:hypothetical protein
MPVGFAKDFEFRQPFLPRCFVRVPTKVQLVELVNSKRSHVRRLALFEQRKVSALFLHPQAELGKDGMIQRSMTVSRFLTKRFQVGPVRIPRRTLCVPGKANPVENLNALRRDAGLLAIRKALELFSVQKIREVDHQREEEKSVHE